MTTIEIINCFMKGYEKVTITEKQRSWLLSIAKKEKYKTDNYDTILYFNDCYYTIENCKRFVSGGSYVGTRAIPGKFNLSKYYHIQFTNGEKITACYDKSNLDYFKREGHPFIIINPVTFKPI